MTRYRLRYVTYAAEQVSHLPAALRSPYETRLDDLRNDPRHIGDYSDDTASYSTTFAAAEESGIILYIVDDNLQAVTILRVNWVKW